MMRTALRIRQGLMFLACVASAIPWSFAGGTDQVRVPSGGERWSVGSNVQLEWELSGADSVNLYLVDADHDNQVVDTIAKGIENRSPFQWFISEPPGGVDSASRHKICVTADCCNGASVALSDVINLQQHAQPETFRGNRQSYTLDDRAHVYIPAAGEIVTRDKKKKVTLRWDDVDHWLLDRIKVEVRQHGKTIALKSYMRMNTGFEKIKIKNDMCPDTDPCYFRINSTRHPDRVITSGHFIVGDTPDLASPNCGENLDQDTKYFAIGEQLEVGWTVGESDLGQDLRVELYKDGSYYLTIAERQLSSAGNRLVEPWTIPFSVREADDYTIRVSSRDHGKVLGFSDVFSIERAREEPVTMAITLPLAGVLWERKKEDGRARFKIKWEDSAVPDAPSSPDHVKIALYKNDRRFKTIFNQGVYDDGEKIPELNKQKSPEEEHTWVMPQTVPSGSDYSVRVMSHGDESGYESDYDDSDQFEISNYEVGEIDAFDAGGSDDADCPVSVQLLCLEDSADCPLDEEQDEAYALTEVITTTDGTSAGTEEVDADGAGSDGNQATNTGSQATNTAQEGENNGLSSQLSDGGSGQSDSQSDSDSQSESQAPTNCFHRIYYIFSDGNIKKWFCL
ncbi:MAG: Ser-Thr-rich GPI-anchored membrane family protein [Alphaproteobacteria bacterium]